MHLIGFIIRIYHAARSPERQMFLILHIIAQLDMPPFTNLRISKIMKKRAKTAVRNVVKPPPQNGYF